MYSNHRQRYRNEGRELGFGLDYMRERVEMLKGSLSFGNRRDNVSGFVLEAEIPVRGVKLEEDE